MKKNIAGLFILMLLVIPVGAQGVMYNDDISDRKDFQRNMTLLGDIYQGSQVDIYIYYFRHSNGADIDEHAEFLLEDYVDSDHYVMILYLADSGLARVKKSPDAPLSDDDARRIADCLADESVDARARQNEAIELLAVCMLDGGDESIGPMARAVLDQYQVDVDQPNNVYQIAGGVVIVLIAVFLLYRRVNGRKRDDC